MDSEKLLLTVEEAADVVGLSRSKVYELLAAGRVASVQIGRARRVPKKSLEDFVDGLIRDRPEV